MPRVRTHYDNLKVARDAPIEVIKAAYKSLSLKYHPDQHQGSDRASRIMRIINTSYEVLSDPVSRLQHDQWIANQETDLSPPPPPPEEKSKTGTEPQTKPPAPEVIQVTSGWFQKDGWQSWLIGVIVFIMVIASFIPWDKPARIVTPDQLTPPGAAQPESTDPITDTAKRPTPREFISVEAPPTLAPNGEWWPKTSGYLPGFQIGNATGGSTATIKNRQAEDDMLVNLCDHSRGRVVRTFFLRAHEDFVMENLDPGEYDIRYENLRSGDDRESEPFTLGQHEERHSETDGIHVEQVSTTFELTLYTVAFGNTRSKPISRERFLGNE